MRLLRFLNEETGKGGIRDHLVSGFLNSVEWNRRSRVIRIALRLSDTLLLGPFPGKKRHGFRVIFLDQA